MINNSSLALADRLNSKNLDAQFKNLMIQGLNCSSFEAEAVVETVHTVYANQFVITKSIKTGQIQLQVISI
ncbi:MAG: hypothetical protein KAH32_03555 [Chlamydiia bacterium]|nr:hypothetical protein [Chlamydiia bacterium]